MKLLAVDRAIEVRQQFAVVRHGQKRYVVTTNVIEQDFHHMFFVRRIKISSWFIAQEQRRFEEQSSAECNALPFALRQRAGITPKLICEAHIVCQFESTISMHLLQTNCRRESARKQNVVQHREMFEQLEFLKHQSDVADAEGSPRTVCERRNVRSIGRHPPFRRNENARDQIQNGCLPAPTWSDDGSVLATRYLQSIDLQSKVAATVLKPDVLKIDHTVLPERSSSGGFELSRMEIQRVLS